MFQCKSILDSLKCSDKRVNDWLRNNDTKNLIEGFLTMREFPHGYNLIKKTKTTGSITDGYYIHRLLVNHFAMWANKNMLIKYH